MKYYGENKYYRDMHLVKWGDQEAKGRYLRGKLPIDELATWRGGKLMLRVVDFIE